MPSAPDEQPAAQVAFTYRIRLSAPGDERDRALASAEAALTASGGVVVGVVWGPHDGPRVVAEVTVRAASAAHARALVHAAGSVGDIEVLDVTDVVMDLHRGGKIAVTTTRPVHDAGDLALVYTPGVARVCTAIAEEPERARELTIKANSVAVVSDGSAVLGLGDIGPAAAMPVMEGKAMLLRDFAGVDAWPICLDERDPDRLVDIIAALSVGFGGINLEDISAPRCFEVEGKLRQRLDIPVFHDDQHGTAVVVLAALINAAVVVGKPLADLTVVVQGIGAAGIAVSNLLMAAGVRDLIGVDQDGIVTPRRRDARDPIFRRFGKQTNPRHLEGSKEIALEGADAVIGLSAGNTIGPEHLALMAPDPIVFAMANPTPEIDPDLARRHGAAVVATGRSDHPNQINNVLCFPGLFRGLLDARARAVTTAVELAAARAIADLVADPVPDRIIPSPFDRAVVPAVANAVADQQTARTDSAPTA